jgi:hypothetical protein
MPGSQALLMHGVGGIVGAVLGDALIGKSKASMPDTKKMVGAFIGGAVVGQQVGVGTGYAGPLVGGYVGAKFAEQWSG